MSEIPPDPCAVCGSSGWLALPDPTPDRSITTAGILLPGPLAKAHCARCGLVQRVGALFLGNTSYYEQQYAAYYSRPGASAYDAPRYTVMARWMETALEGFVPNRILDVGCGAGWSMRVTQERYPKAQIEGIEPSEANSAIAISHGFAVHRQRLGHGAGFEGQYDLIYSNNVLMHVVDPEAFLSDLASGLADGGRIVIICPDATEPSNELLWADHNYSFKPMHLDLIARRAGLKILHWSGNPDNVTVLNKQLFVLAKDAVTAAAIPAWSESEDSLDRLHQERCAYMTAWSQVDRLLCASVASSDRLFNFGASMWTWLLAGNCPEYWRQLNTCIVDDFSGRCLDKPVIATNEVTLGSGDCVVLGVNPRTQQQLAARLQSLPSRIVTWDDCVIA